MCRARSASAAVSSFLFRISDCFFLSPSRNQSVRNSSSTYFMPLSSRICFISWRLLVWVGMPHSKTLKPGFRGGFHPVQEIKGAILFVRVRQRRRDRPIRSEQFDIIFHGELRLVYANERCG